jgi:hypothetical protein
MGQLHEVLAVENELKNIAKKVIEEGMNTFSKKPEHFIGTRKTLRMFDDARSNEEASAAQNREMVTTVNDKLDFISSSIIKALDATAQKEFTNQLAKADIILNGTTIATNIPATFLLTLEKELISYRNLYLSIPTLQPGIKWIYSPDLGENIYITDKADIKSKTEKTRLHKEISKATKEHKAQMETWTEDRPVGNYETIHTSGMITPARKSVMIGRIDDLIQAVKKARTRANNEEIVDVHIGENIFNYINA